MEGFWAIFFLLVVLKIPVFGALWLVWWASKSPQADGTAEDSDGGFRRRTPEPIRPRGPRRGPHGGGAARLPVPCPPGGRTHVVRPPAQPAYSASAQKPRRSS